MDILTYKLCKEQIDTTTDELMETKAGALINTVSGSTVSVGVDNTVNKGLQIVRLNGQTNQITYTGKNLLNNQMYTRTISGVTFTVNTDGTIDLSGTSSGSIDITMNNSILLPEGTYILSGGYSNHISISLSINNVSSGGDTGSGLEFSVSSGDSVMVKVQVDNQIATSGVKLKPMIRASIDDETYEPYVGGVPSPSANYPQVITPLRGYDTKNGSGTSTTYSRTGNYDPTANQYYAIQLTINNTSRWIGTTTKIAPLYENDTIDFVTGEVIRNNAIITSYTGETIPDTWVSSKDIYDPSTTPSAGAYVVYVTETSISSTVEISSTTEGLRGQMTLSAENTLYVRYTNRIESYVTDRVLELIEDPIDSAHEADYGIYDHICDSRLWTNGFYHVPSGAKKSSDSMLCNIADTYIPDSWGLITVDPAETQHIGIRLHGWDSSGTYVGMLVPGTKTWSKLDSSYVRANMPERINLDEIRSLYPHYRFKIMFRGKRGDFQMSPAIYGTNIHVWQTKAVDHPKVINWRWTLGSINANTSLPASSTERQRSAYIPCGIGTRLEYVVPDDITNYQGMWVFEYDKNWNPVSFGAMTTWCNRYSVRNDGYIRILLRNPGNAAITDMSILDARLKCTNYVPPSFEESEKFKQYDWTMGSLSSGVVNQNITTSMVTESIHYAEQDIRTKFDTTNYYLYVAYYAPDGTFVDQTAYSREGMLCIPKGVYYRISLHYATSERVSPSLVDAYEIKEGVDLLWYGGHSMGNPVAIFPRTDTMITPEILYSGRGLTIYCTNTNYQILHHEFDSSDPYGGIKREGSYDTKVSIGPETWYRIIVKCSNPGIANVAEAISQLKWERAEDVDAGIAIESVSSMAMAAQFTANQAIDGLTDFMSRFERGAINISSSSTSTIKSLGVISKNGIYVIFFAYQATTADAGSAYIVRLSGDSTFTRIAAIYEGSSARAPILSTDGIITLKTQTTEGTVRYGWMQIY